MRGRVLRPVLIPVEQDPVVHVVRTSWSLVQKEAMLGVCTVTMSVRSSSSQVLAPPLEAPTGQCILGQNDHGPGPRSSTWLLSFPPVSAPTDGFSCTHQ